MRYYSYNEMTDDGGNEVVTVSEEYIRQTYYPYWQKRMQESGKNLEDYNFADCLFDWVVVNWAWESTNELNEPDEAQEWKDYDPDC